MKKINWFNLGFIFAGCFLGAGFLSGNELKQFFGNFGISGIFGCLISVVSICLFGAMILYISKNKIFGMFPVEAYRNSTARAEIGAPRRLSVCGFVRKFRMKRRILVFCFL